MTDTGTIAAVAGVAGGAGATRLTVETAATLGRAGRDVAVVDAAFATQGLADYVPGRLDPDLTRVLVDEATLGAAAVDPEWPVEGRVVAYPTRAPFERLARAETAAAARSLADCLAQAAERYDAVLVDVPPVASNAAVAAVTEADRVALVVPPGERGVAALDRTRDRLADVGAGADAVLANRASHEDVDADATVPASDATGPSGAPACVDSGDEFARSVAAAAEATVGDSLGLSFEDEGLLDGALG